MVMRWNYVESNFEEEEEFGKKCEKGGRWFCTLDGMFPCIFWPLNVILCVVLVLVVEKSEFSLELFCR